MTTPQTNRFTTQILHADRRGGAEQGAIHKPIHSSVQYGYERVVIVPVPEYRRYRLYAPRPGYRWVRDDGGNYLLVSIASGIIGDILTRNGL